MAMVEPFAELARAYRRPVPESNPFRAFEHAFADIVEHNWDLWRDTRDAAYELTFNAIFGSPWMHRIGEPEQVLADASGEPVSSLRDLPQVQAALGAIDKGGLTEAVIRMMILMAHARGSVRRSRLERSNEILSSEEPFASLSADERSRIIHEQTIVVDFEPERAVDTLPDLLPDAADRSRAYDLVRSVAGPRADMDAPTAAMLDRLAKVLEVRQEESTAA